MRLFIAAPLSPELSRKAGDIQDALRDRGVRGRYTPPENLHLTLAFLGEIPDPMPVLDVMEGFSFSPVTVTADRVGFFGDVWWMGFGENPALEALVRKLRHRLSEAGIPFDGKRFKAHVTLLRRPEGPATGPIALLETGPQDMRIGHLSLMRSDRGRHGMIYTEIGAAEALRTDPGA